MAKAQTYSLETIQAARERLRQLPAKEKEKSRTEAAELLRSDLRKARQQGYSLKEIQAVLTEAGVKVSVSRMEAILEQPGKKPAQKKAEYPKAEELFTMPASPGIESKADVKTGVEIDKREGKQETEGETAAPQKAEYPKAEELFTPIPAASSGIANACSQIGAKISAYQE